MEQVVLEPVVDIYKRIFDLEWNVLIKDIMSPHIYKFIDVFNNQNTNDYKIVIGGGQALNYYFNNNVFETKDFDCGMIDTTGENDINNMIQHKRGFIEYLSVQLNEKAQYFYNEFHLFNANKPINVNFSSKDDPQGISTCNLVIKLEKEEYNESIFNLAIYPHLVHNGISHKFKIPDNVYDLDTGKFRGFIQRPIDHKNRYNIYYVTMGFLIWDSVRMIREYENIIKRSRNNDNNIIKFQKYLNKYKQILRALDDPKNFMNCDSIFVDEVKKCNIDNKICNETTKENLVIYLYNIYKVYDENFSISLFEGMSFEQLCKIVRIIDQAKNIEETVVREEAVRREAAVQEAAAQLEAARLAATEKCRIAGLQGLVEYLTNFYTFEQLKDLTPDQLCDAAVKIEVEPYENALYEAQLYRSQLYQ